MELSKAQRLFEMLKSGEVDLTVNGVVLGRAKITNVGKRDVEIFPPIEFVSMTVQFVDK